MFIAIAVILSLFSVALSNQNRCQNVTCPKVPKHYDELGCQPIYIQGYCCPHRYDCTDFFNRDPNRCYHRGQPYKLNDILVDAQLESSCNVGCRCSKHYEQQQAKFDCAHIDCPEFFGDYDDEKVKKGKHCVSLYKRHGCCIEREACDEELKSLARCTFQGQTYYEGQQIHPEGSCYTCWCGKGFEDKPVHLNKHCTKIDCDIDLHYSDEIRSGCVPIYFQTEDCCPIDKRCPDHNTKIIKAKNSVPALEGHECTFGNLKLAVGDSLTPESSNNCRTCTCKIPPHVTCIQTC